MPSTAARLLQPGFVPVLAECLACREFVAEVDRLYGTRLAASATPLERMIDATTGALDADLARFVEVVDAVVYSRLT